jgi:multidrug transporter EmrE-like cation transporter
MSPWVFVFFAATFSTIGNLFMKKTAENFNINEYYTATFLGFMGIFFYIINLIFFILALRQLNVSITYPVLSMSSFLMLNIMAILIFNERFSAVQFLAMGMIILGLILLVFDNG